MVDYNRSLVPGPDGPQAPATPSRVTGAIGGALVGSILPLGPIGTVAGAVVGGIFGPRSKIVNDVSGKALQQLGKWAGR